MKNDGGQAVAALEARLNDFDAAARAAALAALAAHRRAGRLCRRPPAPLTNLHCHSFYSYNARGWSPGRIVWEACRAGWETVGVVDFDVLDGLAETLEAGGRLGVRAVCGLETRVFVPEYADREINSPGEPGVFYFVGAGFARCPAGAAAAGLRRLRALAAARNRAVAGKLSPVLAPELSLDYAREVLALTPAGNATERHLVAAIDQLARQRFGAGSGALAGWWARRLSLEETAVARLLADPVAFQETLRARLMKRGGPGYMPAAPDSFIPLAEAVALVRAAGGLPVGTWLDGTSAGERPPGRWLRFLLAQGVVALTVIPDRNWNLADPAEQARKSALLAALVTAAGRLGLPLVAGTEMNRPGQRLVDDFGAPALAPWRDRFRAGAFFLYGQTMMARLFRRGFYSRWALAHLPGRCDRTRFYTEFGRHCPPDRRPGDYPRPPAGARPRFFLDLVRESRA